jgi:hypothetical protein
MHYRFIALAVLMILGQLLSQGQTIQAAPPSNNEVVMADDTNVCDGVTCEDGSCAATADECIQGVGLMPEASVCQSGADDCDDSDPDVRPNANDCGIDDDCDGMTDEDILVPINDCDDNGSCPRPDVDTRVETASQSVTIPEKAPDSMDPDDDADLLPTVIENSAMNTLTWREGEMESIDALSELANDDSSVVCWGRGEDAAGKVYNWGDGLCLNPAEESQINTSISLDGIAIRRWNDSEQEAWQEFTGSIENTSVVERLSIKTISAIQDDDRIMEMQVSGGDDPEETVSLDFKPVIVRYQAQMNLFGFIPMEREVQASIDNEGSVTIDYPWYSFLASKPATEKIITLLVSTRDILTIQ